MLKMTKNGVESKKINVFFFRNPPVAKIVTFSLTQKGCHYFEKCHYFGCHYFEWTQYIRLSCNPLSRDTPLPLCMTIEMYLRRFSLAYSEKRQSKANWNFNHFLN